MMKELQRVIKPNGIYFGLSFGSPEEREVHLKKEHLSFSIQTIKRYSSSNDATTPEDKEEQTHYVYICTKLQDADEISKKHSPTVHN